jgi:hypothetical protein
MDSGISVLNFHINCSKRGKKVSTPKYYDGFVVQLASHVNRVIELPTVFAHHLDHLYDQVARVDDVLRVRTPWFS